MQIIPFELNIYPAHFQDTLLSVVSSGLQAEDLEQDRKPCDQTLF